MEAGRPATLAYKRSRFSTQLPVDYLYSPTHYWMGRQADGTWRVGMTRFATRMLGEMVDHGFEIKPGSAVAVGEIIGWVEGFKAISDVFCVAEGKFLGGNPALAEKVGLLGRDGYALGWLYAVTGEPDARCVDVQAYREILDRTIDKILEKEAEEEK